MDRAAASACLAASAACWYCPASASASATRARASACSLGSVMDRATACACWYCPASASAPATRARASARLTWIVIDRAATSVGLLVLPGLSQRPRHPGQGVGLPVRVGDGPGGHLRPLAASAACWHCPASASASATRARA